MAENAGDGSVVDVAIVGAGPVGLFGAFYAGLRGLSVKIVDSLEILGGQLTTLYPEKYIYDVPGFPRILAKDLANNLAEQAGQYKPDICLGDRVEMLTREGEAGLFNIRTQSNVHRARVVIIAAGVGAFEPKTLALPEAQRFFGRGLQYFVRELQTMRGKRVLIVGGGDSCRGLGQHDLSPGRVGDAHPSPRSIPRPRGERGPDAPRNHENHDLFRAKKPWRARSDRASRHI